eukprot:scpid80578/ scgid0163/ Leucine-rich repeat flightless-interacting protein 2
MSSGADTVSTAGRVRSSRNTSAENQAIQSVITKGEKQLAERRSERAEARRLRLRNLEEERRAEDKDEELNSGTVTPSRRAIRKQESTDPMFSPDLADLYTKDKVIAIEKKWRSTMETNDELLEQKIKLVQEVDKMKDRIEDAIDVHAELLCDREHYIEAVKESQDSATHQHEELELLCAQLVARQQYMQELDMEWPPQHLLNGDEGHSTEEGESTCNHTSEEDTEVTTEEDEYEERLLRRPSQHDIKERQKQILLTQIGRLKQEVQTLQQELKERKSDTSTADSSNAVLLRDTTRLLNDYKARVESAETDQERLTSQVDMLEAQVKRLKGLQEESEAMEDELKLERRKLQREMRQAKNQAEELEVENERLQKRIEQLKRRHQRD